MTNKSITKYLLLSLMLLISSQAYSHPHNMKMDESHEKGFLTELVFEDENCPLTARPKDNCTLAKALHYVDPNGLHWETDKWNYKTGLVNEYIKAPEGPGTTDGASIPTWAIKYVGEMFDRSYLKAAVIHDHYCYKKRRVRSMLKTHRVFYDAMVDLGVERKKAKIMYAAVLIGGPKWFFLEPSIPCTNYSGEGCIKILNNFLNTTKIKKTSYGSTGFNIAMDNVYKALTDNPQLSEAELEALVKAEYKRVNDSLLLPEMLVPQ